MNGLEDKESLDQRRSANKKMTKNNTAVKEHLIVVGAYSYHLHMSSYCPTHLATRKFYRFT